MNDLCFLRVRFHFRARDDMHFPPGKAGNVLRGAFGSVFRRIACLPPCGGAVTCDVRSTCSYARVFEPQAARGEGPSGLKDWPRPFVFRASSLAGTIPAGGEFSFDVHLFDTTEPVLAAFIRTFAQIGRDGLGPGRAKAELRRADLLTASDPRPQRAVRKSGTATPFLDQGFLQDQRVVVEKRGDRPQFFHDFGGRCGSSIHAREGAGPACFTIEPRSDGATIQVPCPLPVVRLQLDPISAAVRRAHVHFITPTELKSGDDLAGRPAFGVLFRRVRDRVSTLRALYGSGPLEIDFKGMGERADRVELVRWVGRTVDAERRSSRTGQRHSIGGFLGEAEYSGDLAEFAPFLDAARWTGVGRHTVWGNGELTVVYDEES